MSIWVIPDDSLFSTHVTNQMTKEKLFIDYYKYENKAEEDLCLLILLSQN